MTADQLVDAIFDREGDAYAEPPKIDQPTARGGVTLGTLGAYVAANPTAHLTVSVQQLQTLTHDQAADIVRWQLRRLSESAGLDAIEFEPLRLLLIDYSYNSGAQRAIRWFQRVLGVPRTGIMDAATVAAVKYPNDKDRILVWIHMATVAARLQMIDSAVDTHSINAKFETGLERRVEAFSLLEVP